MVEFPSLGGICPKDLLWIVLQQIWCTVATVHAEYGSGVKCHWLYCWCSDWVSLRKFGCLIVAF